MILMDYRSLMGTSAPETISIEPARSSESRHFDTGVFRDLSACDPHQYENNVNLSPRQFRI